MYRITEGRICNDFIIYDYCSYVLEIGIRILEQDINNF